MTAEPDKSEKELVEHELLAVRGIGPSVVQRLTDLGLGTLRTLAAAGADDVVGRAAGWPFRPGRQRIQKWIDQARRFVDADAPPAVMTDRDAQPAHSTTPSARVRHTFTLEVQTNDAGAGKALAWLANGSTWCLAIRL